MQKDEWKTDPLLFFYHDQADRFLALAEWGKTRTWLKKEAIKDMRKNFVKKGSSYEPRKCNVLTAYVPVGNQQIAKYLSDTAQEAVAILHREKVPYFEVPRTKYHMSLVMIQDIRPADMDKKTPFEEREVKDLTCRFTEIMEEVETKKYDLTLYGIFFSPKDGALVAAFEDACQTCRLRAEMAGGLQEFRKDQELKYPKNLLLITLLRPLAQPPRRVLRALRDKQRKLFPLKGKKLTLPVHKVVLGKETVWMHGAVKELERVTLR